MIPRKTVMRFGRRRKRVSTTDIKVPLSGEELISVLA
jgi:hypothetical protein